MKRVLALAMIALLAVPASAGLGTSTASFSGGPTDDTDGVAIAAQTNGTVVNGSNVTRTRLELSGDTRHNVTRPSLDLGAAIAADDGALESAYQTRVDQRRIFSASDGDRLVERFTDRVETRIDALRTRERAATQAYAAGDISEQELARRLVLIANEANQLHDQLKALGDVANRRETTLRITSLEFRPRSFTGRAHDELERGLRGTKTSHVSITATQNGYVLGLLNQSEGTYYRQALRFDNRNPDGPTTLKTTDQAFDRLRALYPETKTDEVFIPSLQRARDAGLYEVSINYPEGSSTLYLDAATSSVFFEVKRLDVEAMPRSTVLNRTIDGLRIVVERTYDNGPALVKAFDADTGEPAGVTLAVDGRDVGGTGVNGERWFIAPSGTYQLSVSNGDARFNVTVPAA